MLDAYSRLVADSAAFVEEVKGRRSGGKLNIGFTSASLSSALG